MFQNTCFIKILHASLLHLKTANNDIYSYEKVIIGATGAIGSSLAKNS